MLVQNKLCDFEVMLCCSVIGGGSYKDVYGVNRFNDEIECCLLLC